MIPISALLILFLQKKKKSFRKCLLQSIEQRKINSKKRIKRLLQFETEMLISSADPDQHFRSRLGMQTIEPFLAITFGIFLHFAERGRGRIAK